MRLLELSLARLLLAGRCYRKARRRFQGRRWPRKGPSFCGCLTKITDRNEKVLIVEFAWVPEDYGLPRTGCQIPTQAWQPPELANLKDIASMVAQTWKVSQHRASSQVQRTLVTFWASGHHRRGWPQGWLHVESSKRQEFQSSD